MTASTAKTMVRLLSFLPGVFGALVLLLSVMFCVSAFRELVWWHLALGIAFGCCAVYLFRCVYLSWRRPSSEIVREVCGWTALALLALCSLAVERLDAQGHDRLSTGVAIVALPLVVTVFVTLRRRLLSGIFGVLL
jgi:hypothetical protein